MSCARSGLVLHIFHTAKFISEQFHIKFMKCSRADMPIKAR